MGLRLAADAAFPFDYATLPAGVAAVLGYVGGDTPHVWTAAEITAAEKAVGEWWAIWTAPSTGEILTAAQGERDADGMVAALIARSYPTGRPVFYDVERGTWDASPSGARAAVAAWTATMHAHGWARAYGYLPPDDGHGWIYDWVSERPTSLPAGWIGQQYESTEAYDLSVFDESLWEDDMPTPKDLWEYPVPISKGLEHLYPGQSEVEAQYLVRDASAQTRALGARVDELEKKVADLLTERRATQLAGYVIHGDKDHPNSLDSIAKTIDATKT